jgi:chorismate mutase
MKNYAHNILKAKTGTCLDYIEAVCDAVGHGYEEGIPAIEIAWASLINTQLERANRNEKLLKRAIRQNPDKPMSDILRKEIFRQVMR